MKRPLGLRKRAERGQTLVEFSLALPIMLLLVCGVLEFGLGLRSYVQLSNSVREGARFAAVGNPAGDAADCDGTTSDTVYGRVCFTSKSLDLDELDPDVSFPDGTSPGAPVVVSADYTYNFVTPIGALADFFSGGTFPTSVDLSTSANMRLE